MSIARTMMLHMAIHWPDLADAALWPLAVDHAVYLYNHVPNPSTGLSPHDLMSKTRWPQSQLADCHVWGCPVYVLDKKMQDGKKLPRWKPRSTRQIFVGLSRKHASSVPMCLNPETGAITPQFHVVFDDSFSTVAASVDDLPDLGSDAWMQLFGDSIYQYALTKVIQVSNQSKFKTMISMTYLHWSIESATTKNFTTLQFHFRWSLLPQQLQSSPLLLPVVNCRLLIFRGSNQFFRGSQL